MTLGKCKTYFCIKVSKGAKIRNQYNQVPHLTKDTNVKVINTLFAAYGPVCGGMITIFPGNLTAIDRDSNGYDRNRDCIWNLQAAENHIIILTVHYLKLQRAPDCQKDSLQVRIVVWVPL